MLRPFFLTLAFVASVDTPTFAGDGEWAPGVSYTTDWKAAIKEARQTGKILLIYNGWERRKI